MPETMLNTVCPSFRMCRIVSTPSGSISDTSPARQRLHLIVGDKECGAIPGLLGVLQFYQ
jgi:hypothetical protein